MVQQEEDIVKMKKREETGKKLRDKARWNKGWMIIEIGRNRN